MPPLFSSVLIEPVPPLPMRVFVVPALWSVVGFSAAHSLGIVEDYALPVAGAASIALIAWKKRAKRRIHATAAT